ncbi:MAG: DUF72 domain-containing protein [Acidimicrobiia bacterium]
MASALVETSGWSYQEWRDDLYQDVPRRRWLEHYAGIFPTVEVNMTFRRSLTPPVAAKWQAETPPDFRFAVKAHQRITHLARLAQPGQQLPFFIDTVRLLGERLGPILFQLPPTFARDDDLLASFLDALPDSLQKAFEFRHQSWFTPDVYRILQGHGAALVMAEAETTEPATEITASFAYLRLRRPDYTEAQMRSWAKRIANLPVETAWVYLKDEPTSPRLASLLGELVSEATA